MVEPCQVYTGWGETQPAGGEGAHLPKCETANDGPIRRSFARRGVGDPVEDASTSPSQAEVRPLSLRRLDQVLPLRDRREARDAFLDNAIRLQEAVPRVLLGPVVQLVAVRVVVSRDPEVQLGAEPRNADLEQRRETTSENAVQSPEPFLCRRMSPSAKEEDVGSGRPQMEVAALGRFGIRSAIRFRIRRGVTSVVASVGV
jgi:hypothetical protein